MPSATLAVLLVLACAPTEPGASGPRAGRAAPVPAGTIRMHVRFAPGPAGAEPEAASFAATFAHAGVALVSGPAAAAEDGHTVTWRGSVGAASAADTRGVELVLEPEHLTSRMLFAIEREGREPVQERVFLGTEPLVSTWAVPVYETAPGRAPVAPELALVHDVGASLVDVALQPRASDSGPGTLRVELCFAEPGYAKELVLVPLEGFDATHSLGRRYWAETNAMPYARIVAERRSEDTDVLVVAHLDGRWPAATEVALDGLPVRTDVCRFVLPLPPDGRIGAALVQAPAFDGAHALPPGSIAIWIEHGAERVETDPTAHGAARAVEAAAPANSSADGSANGSADDPAARANEAARDVTGAEPER